MKKSKLYTMALLMATALFSTTSCNKEELGPIGPVIDPTYPTAGQLFSKYESFTKPFLDETLSMSKEEKNIMVSPLSLAEVLAMLCNGAKGETLSQTVSVMGLSSYDKESFNQSFLEANRYLTNCDATTTVSIANSQWFDTTITIKDDYKSTNRKWFDAETFSQDLNTAETMNDINSWCDRKTNGCIRKLLERPLFDTRVVLINALYFKGDWTSPFDSDWTLKEDFTNSNGSVSEVDMMHQTSRFNTWAGKKMDMLELPYGKRNICMEIYLPHKGEKLDDCMKDFNQEFIDSVHKNMSESLILVSLPKMELGYRTSLKKTLVNMGMKDAFDKEAADFSGITDHKIFLDDILQVTYIKVDEKGTEAAAVTGAIMKDYSYNPEEPVNFTVNRPFAYIIREKTSGIILFMGKVVKM